ncbi:MAG: hypothetical protein K2P51_06755 [Rhabdochlamydiaceae bacterium]|nr:hypothetical protein [Rhabdochlamydiaceae bacterium]
MDPINWPSHFIFTPLPFSQDLHPSIFRFLLATGNDQDLEVIHPLLESATVHPDLEIRQIRDKGHVLGSSDPIQHGLFAKKQISQGIDLGTYSGEMKLLNADFPMVGGQYNYALAMKLPGFTFVIDAKKWANEMAFMNDYRKIAEKPNVYIRTVTHRGCYYSMCQTLCPISEGEELLTDYGVNYWKCHK